LFLKSRKWCTKKYHNLLICCNRLEADYESSIWLINSGTKFCHEIASIDDINVTLIVLSIWFLEYLFSCYIIDPFIFKLLMNADFFVNHWKKAIPYLRRILHVLVWNLLFVVSYVCAELQIWSWVQHSIFIQFIYSSFLVIKREIVCIKLYKLSISFNKFGPSHL
jgi:hypothetical protein